MNLEEYLENLQQEVSVNAAREGLEQGLPEVFTERLISTMTDTGYIEDGVVAVYEARGMRVSGFSVDADETTLDVFVTDYVGGPGPRAITRSEMDAAFRRLTTFVSKARNGLWRQIEESSPTWDMAHRIETVWDSLTKIRLSLLTNGRVRSEPPADSVLDGVLSSHHLWDLERLFRLDTSGRQQEPISVDLVELAGAAIPCLGPEGADGDYQTYLLMLPGRVLADIYERYGARLLELNIRSYLQARGKINRGIQETIKDEPRRFLAYNNGISLTASGVDLAPTGGAPAITAIHDLQIVNGGQTTASLHHARSRARQTLDGIFIQAKLSVVEPKKLQDLVPRISEYSNSQNRINSADFSATDPFHVELEKLSRTVWAPGADGSRALTRWFYERARGQYVDALGRERTPARRRQFQLIHPPGQKFTKTDVAKFENTWDQLPHIVARGQEKSFREFTLRLKQRGALAPDLPYFQRLVAKALMFNTAERLIGGLKLGAYRSQTVTYTLALIANRTAQRIDLDEIWATQRLPEPLRLAIVELAPDLHAVLLSVAGRANISEWAKKEECWTETKKLAWQPDPQLREILLDPKQATHTRRASVAEILNVDEQRDMDVVSQTPAETWFSLAAWAKQTANLGPWQRSLAFSLGRLLASGRIPSRKQATQGAVILQEARRLGFTPEAARADLP